MSKLNSTTTAALQRHDTAVNALRHHYETNRAVIDEFLSLLSDQEMANDTVRELIRHERAPLEEGLKAGDFMRTSPKQRVDYDPARLPAKALELPGVIKSVNVEVLEQHVLAGKLFSEDIEDARTTKEAKPQVRGPRGVKVAHIRDILRGD